MRAYTGTLVLLAIVIDIIVKFVSCESLAYV